MYRFTQVEDQEQAILPLNRDTEQLYYNVKICIDAPVLTEPRFWQVSKVNRSRSLGVAVYTFAQDTFNQHTSKAFYDEEGNVTAWWADWDTSPVPPTEGIQKDESLIISITSKITASGTMNQIKVGGSKTFTVNYYEDDQQISHSCGDWSFSIDGADATKLLSLSYPSENKVKVKFLGGDEYIGKILSVKNTTEDGVESALDVGIIAL